MNIFYGNPLIISQYIPETLISAIMNMQYFQPIILLPQATLYSLINTMCFAKNISSLLWILFWNNFWLIKKSAKHNKTILSFA